MSTLQNTTQHRDRIKTRLGAAALALGVLMALGIVLLTLPTAHRTTTPSTASVTRPAPPAALTTQASGLGNCLVDPYTPAIACYHAARNPIATAAPSSYFRDGLNRANHTHITPTTHPQTPSPYLPTIQTHGAGVAHIVVDPRTGQAHGTVAPPQTQM